MAFGPFLLLALMEGLVTAAVLSLAAVGLSLVFGVMRVVNVAHGEFFMLGAVIAWFVSTMVPGPAWLAFAAALIVAPVLVAALAAMVDGLVLKRLSYNPEATILATIGVMYMIQQAALSYYGPDARPVLAPFSWRLQLPWFGYSGYKLFVVLAAGLVLLAVWLGLTRSKAGLVMRATQVDREVAQAFGINVGLVYRGVFALGAGLAALGAVLYVPISQAHYLMGHDPLLLSFIVVIIGGLGSLRGTLVAALVIGLSDGVISMFFSPTLAKILATLLVGLVLVFRPQGLFGAKE
ncbi:branched-chain amino acid ABC transporter permease [Xinfangfangia sp. CPCC 101601]|uniref:Branched-chain amino acid ABC transporter permease n=1 Tax=Pseudogemmobacter lacusdianii TaxID=3069608 RepID=A0ABU0W0Z6_9RHOB|nr:branched-chain amino acid ABC transporter permease [Xinfangfangia sp. CPCC 101601]MDQ2067652.1 branched-chain amino acid ABC transporter permease [Xinfangfangia sp. CPCC 101601]